MSDRKASKLVRTERAQMSMDDFAQGIFELGTGQESFNLLLFADTNAGKTHLAATHPGKGFWLVCEPGYKTAARLGAIGRGAKIADTATAWAAVEWLEYKNRFKKFDYIVLDGISTMQDRFRLSYTQEAFDASEGQPKRARAHRNLPDKPDYFNTQNFLRSWIPRLVDLPVNFIITAHAWRTDETDADLLVYPGIQGKVTEMANTISGLMDATAYLARKTVTTKKGDTKAVRRLYFDQPPSKKGDEVRYMVGEKFGTLPGHVDNPTMAKLLSHIEQPREEA